MTYSTLKKEWPGSFYYDDKAQDHTHWISSDHSFIALFSSVLSGKAAQHFEMESIGPKITQDFLLLGSNEDHFIPVELYKRVIDALPNVKSLTYKMYTKYDHAENHCNFGNTELVLSDIVHWMLQSRNK